MGEVPLLFSPNKQPITRRDFLEMGMAVPFLGWFGYKIVDWTIQDRVLQPRLYGKYLDLENGTGSLSDTANIIQVELLPETIYGFEGKILLRPELNLNAELLTLPIERFRNSFAIRVFGEGFRQREKTENSRGSIIVQHEDRRYRGGQWLMLTNAERNPTNPLDTNEEGRRFYTSNDFKLL